MASRVDRFTGKQSPSGRSTITTFHAFALQILHAEFDGRSNFNRIGFTGTPQCSDESGRLALLAKCCGTDEREQLGVDIFKLDAMLERLKVFPESIDALTPEKADLLRLIAARLRERKQAEGIWDFSDLIEGAVELFERYPVVLEHYRSKYLEVLVDEFQDTNPIQIRLLRQILRSDKNLFAVGDDDQAIYGFRGADIRPILSFAEGFPGAQIIKLQTNYRSTPAILSRANRIFRSKDPAYRKVLVSGKYGHREGAAPSIHFFSDQSAMADWLMVQVESCSAALKIPASGMVALFRINQTAEWMADYFDGKGISSEHRPQFLTVHKSKGLEFPLVFLCDMEESVFPSYRERKRKRIRNVAELLRSLTERQKKPIECDWDEEQRLFYVAVTRAEQRLFFCVARSKQMYGRNRQFRPSRFLRLIR